MIEETKQPSPPDAAPIKPAIDGIVQAMRCLVGLMNSTKMLSLQCHIGGELANLMKTVDWLRDNQSYIESQIVQRNTAAPRAAQG